VYPHVCVSGIATGSVLFIVFACFSAMGLYLLSCSARTVGISPSSYYVVAHAALPNWTLAVDLAVAIKCFGVATSYLIVIGNLMPDAMRGILPHDSTSVLLNRHFWITIASIAIAPLAAQRSFSSLKYTATLAIGFVSFLVTMVFAYAVVPQLRSETCAGSGRSCDKRHDVWAFGTVSQVLRVLSIFVFAFTCHQNIFSVCNEIKAPTQQRVNTVILLAISAAVCVHLVLAWGAYSTFGSGVAANILGNYPHGALLTCARVCVSLLVATGYPLQAHPSRRSLLTVVQTVRANYRRRKREQNVYSALPAHSTSVDNSSGNHSSSIDVHSSSNGSLNTSYRNSSSNGGSSGRITSSSVSPMRKTTNHQSALQHIPPLHTSSKQSSELPLYDATQQLAKRRRSQNSKTDDSIGGSGSMNNSHHGVSSSSRATHSHSSHELQALMMQGNTSSSACSSPVMRKSPRDSRHFSATASGGRSNDVSLRRNTSGASNGKPKRGDSYFSDETADGVTAANGNVSHSSSSLTAAASNSALGYVHHDRDSSSSDDDMSPDSASQAMFMTITVAFVLSTYVIAMAVADLGIVLEIVGATGSTIISYILPGSTYLSLHPIVKGKFQSMRLFASVQLVVGCIIMPVCLFFVIRGEGSH
jgi:amino acid permease